MDKESYLDQLFFRFFIFFYHFSFFLFAQSHVFTGLQEDNLTEQQLLEKIILTRKSHQQFPKFYQNNLEQSPNSTECLIEPLGNSPGLRYVLFIKTYFVAGLKWKDLIYFDRVQKIQHVFPINNPKVYLQKKKKYNAKFNIIEKFQPKIYFFQKKVLVHENLPFELEYKVLVKNKLPKIRLFVTGDGNFYWGGILFFNRILANSPRISMVYDCLLSLAVVVEFSFLLDNKLQIQKEIFFLPADLVDGDLYKLNKKNNYDFSRQQEQIVYQKRYIYRENFLKKEFFYLSGKVIDEYVSNH